MKLEIKIHDVLFKYYICLPLKLFINNKNLECYIRKTNISEKNIFNIEIPKPWIGSVYKISKKQIITVLKQCKNKKLKETEMELDIFAKSNTYGNLNFNISVKSLKKILKSMKKIEIVIEEIDNSVNKSTERIEEKYGN